MLLDCGSFNSHQYTNVMDQRGDDLHKKNKVLVLAKRSRRSRIGLIRSKKSVYRMGIPTSKQGLLDIIGSSVQNTSQHTPVLQGFENGFESYKSARDFRDNFFKCYS